MQLPCLFLKTATWSSHLQRGFAMPEQGARRRRGPQRPCSCSWCGAIRRKHRLRNWPQVHHMLSLCVVAALGAQVAHGQYRCRIHISYVACGAAVAQVLGPQPLDRGLPTERVHLHVVPTGSTCPTCASKKSCGVPYSEASRSSVSMPSATQPLPSDTLVHMMRHHLEHMHVSHTATREGEGLRIAPQLPPHRASLRRCPMRKRLPDLGDRGSKPAQGQGKHAMRIHHSRRISRCGVALTLRAALAPALELPPNIEAPPHPRRSPLPKIRPMLNK